MPAGWRIGMRDAREIIRLVFVGIAARDRPPAWPGALDGARDVEANGGRRPVLPLPATYERRGAGGGARQPAQQTRPSTDRGTGLGLRASRTEAQARHPVDPLGRVHRREPGRLQLLAVLRALSILREDAVGDDAADARRRRAAVRRLRRRRRSGRHRSAHRRNCMAQIFVAVGSVELHLRQGNLAQALPDWIDAHVRAFEAIGGVPELVVPDNAKTAVVKPSFYDPEVNRTYDMAVHYGTAILAREAEEAAGQGESRAGRPDRRALAAREAEALDLHQPRRRRRRAWRAYDGSTTSRPCAGSASPAASCSRRSTARRLKALPDELYEYSKWRVRRVGVDYHVDIDAQYYSVPNTFARAEVEARLIACGVEIFHKGERIAVHLRVRKRET